MKTCRFILPLLVMLVAAPVRVQAQKYGKVVDRVVAIIGNEAIMLSDVESEVKVLKAQTAVSDANARCEVLEQMMKSKVFLMQARLDSLTVNNDIVEMQISQRLDYFRSTLGGDEAAEQYFGKSLYKLRKEWRTQLEEMSLQQQEQQRIASTMPEVTPHDVDCYLDTADVSELPIIPIKYQLSQICIYPDRQAAALAVKEKLLQLRSRIIDGGERFSTLARLYSEDTGTAIRGGEIGMASASMFHSEFSDAALALKPGMISQIVETMDGFHIIEVIEKKGDMFNARHILLKPKYTADDRIKAFRTLDSLRSCILDSTLTFELAARIYSQDPLSRTNGGQMSDPQTGTAYFEIDRLKPQDYFAIKNLKPGEISDPVESLDNEGRNGNTVYKIVRLDKIIPSHIATRERDYATLLEGVTQVKQQEAIEQFIRDKIKDTYIRIDPLFRDCNFENPGWLERASENF